MSGIRERPASLSCEGGSDVILDPGIVVGAIERFDVGASGAR